MKRVTAVWSGPFPAILPDGTTVEPGDKAEIPEADLVSAHWTVPSKTPPKGES